jgi:hypothetical protein
MDTVVNESNTNRKHARDNAQKVHSRKLPLFRMPTLLPLLFSHCSQVLSNPWQSPFWIHSSNSELSSSSTITKKQTKIKQGRLPSHLDMLQIRFEYIIDGPPTLNRRP